MIVYTEFATAGNEMVWSNPVRQDSYPPPAVAKSLPT